MEHLTSAEIQEAISHVSEPQIGVSSVSVRHTSGWTVDGLWISGVQVSLTVTKLSSAHTLATRLRLRPRASRRDVWAGWSYTSSGLRIECVLELSPAPQTPTTIFDSLAIGLHPHGAVTASGGLITTKARPHPSGAGHIAWATPTEGKRA